MATKFLNRYGNALNEINYDSTQYLSTTGTAAAATKLATARTITLGSDCSGSVSFDGSSNVTLNVTVKDDSHNHTISNIDNLQTTLDGKVNQQDGKIEGNPSIFFDFNDTEHVEFRRSGNPGSYDISFVYIDANGNKTFSSIYNMKNKKLLPDLDNRVTTLENFMNKYSSMLNIIGNNA